MNYISKWFKKNLLLARLEEDVKFYSSMLQSIDSIKDEFDHYQAHLLVKYIGASRRAIRRIKKL